MDASEKEIVTTTEVARILGVSVRTAQLLVEGGSIPSWKTPGGHRRVYRSDVVALVKGQEAGLTPASARVIVIAPPERLPALRVALERARSCFIDAYPEPFTALLDIGGRSPAAVVIDAGLLDGAEGLLHALSGDAALQQTALLVVGAEGRAFVFNPLPTEGRVRFIDNDADLAEAAEAAVLGTTSDAAAPIPGLFPLPDNETQRLLALERSGLVDTPPEDAFDRLTWLAAQTLGTPISLITLLTPTRQWFKSRQGLDMADTPRSWAFCNHTILQGRCTIFEDLSADPRFADNPAVADTPNFRFYAGCPIVDPDGFSLGSLCVIDTRPRTLDDTQKNILSNLAALVSDEIRLRVTDTRLRRAMDALDRKSR
ncbi:MAG: excisionase family DNA-binding protein [Alphaproteobacteria bacterium]|uniref:GAF domain-containing protein n=1 Tax=Brevundimonas sp. TaxID=1871086 RepID=UPI001DE7E982|nr:excisionase family DNA-binding protein [Alphaproteobacteria bacterium]MBU1520374.1 excisionase family DNA-binding protein [Alphaproteobacteria bacterium]MBU2029840.1 excisionase family DNA-binding protein [Alphaproteobacteria bacterium]MBU2164666.1 excisionase family DNA-binding protein [Alphaproteobacteria bacterium]MBU2231433.1 excisionase family DNA-binding protein [Alphaproteobacteria bacterium]